MTVVFYVLAGIGAITVLASIALIGAGIRETALCRHIDAHTPTPPIWVNDGRQDWPELAAWERDIRTPGRLEDWLEQETGQ